jgi:hypothetical protein
VELDEHGGLPPGTRTVGTDGRIRALGAA